MRFLKTPRRDSATGSPSGGRAKVIFLPAGEILQGMPGYPPDGETDAIAGMNRHH
jgi:hypothetical protein